MARGWGPGRRRNERRRARRCHGAVLGRRRRPETRRQRRRGHPLACSSVARVHLHPRLRQQESGRRRAIPRACGPWFGGCGPRQPQSRRRARGFGFPRMPSPGHDCSVAFRRREGRCCSNLSQAASGIAPPSAGRSLAVGAADKGWRQTCPAVYGTLLPTRLLNLHLVFGTPLANPGRGRRGRRRERSCPFAYLFINYPVSRGWGHYLESVFVFYLQ